MNIRIKCQWIHGLPTRSDAPKEVTRQEFDGVWFGAVREQIMSTEEIAQYLDKGDVRILEMEMVSNNGA